MARDRIIEVVKTNYSRYKYMFRAMPTNASTLFKTFLFGLIKQIIAPKVAALYGFPTPPDGGVPAYIIAENLVWCDRIILEIAKYSLGGPSREGYLSGLDLKGWFRPSPIATDFSWEFDRAEAAGAKIVIHIFSGPVGANFVKQYGTERRPFVIVGFNLESQMQEFYTAVEGACEYETLLAPLGTQEGVPPINPDAKPLTSVEFWRLYEARYGHSPIYTAWGAYDWIVGLNETSWDATLQNGWMRWWKGWITGTDPVTGSPIDKETAINNLIVHTETLGVSDGFAGKRVEYPPGSGVYFRNHILGLFKYTGPNGKYHDVYCAPDCMSPLWPSRTVRGQIPQWQAGRMNVVFPRDQPFSRKWIIPPWRYGLETDFAGGPLIPTGIDAFNYTSPDGVVDMSDLRAATMPGVWGRAPPWWLLEADMQPQNHVIDVYDISRIGKDWLREATPQ